MNDMKEWTGLTTDELIYAAEDRIQWRIIVKNVLPPTVHWLKEHDDDDVLPPQPSG
jgi:hypothetical protein